MKETTVARYPKLCASIEPILLTFLTLYRVKSGFSYEPYLLSKQRRILRGDLRLKLINKQPNSLDLLYAH